MSVSRHASLSVISSWNLSVLTYKDSPLARHTRGRPSSPNRLGRRRCVGAWLRPRSWGDVNSHYIAAERPDPSGNDRVRYRPSQSAEADTSLHLGTEINDAWGSIQVRVLSDSQAWILPQRGAETRLRLGAAVRSIEIDHELLSHRSRIRLISSSLRFTPASPSSAPPPPATVRSKSAPFHSLSSR
ncbi:MAG: hypothetical protein RL417_2483 [Pseudomonadota bacterium]